MHTYLLYIVDYSQLHHFAVHIKTWAEWFPLQDRIYPDYSNGFTQNRRLIYFVLPERPMNLFCKLSHPLGFQISG